MHLFFMGCLFCTFTVTFAHNSSYPFTLQKVFSYGDGRAIRLVPVDLENDGTDEFLFLCKEEDKINYSIRLFRSFQEQVIAQRNYPVETLYDVFCFTTIEGESRICAGLKEGNKIYLDILDGKLNLVNRFFIVEGHDNNRSGSWDGNGRPLAGADLNGDGHQEILFVVQANYDAFPRGLWAIDLYNSKIFWSYQTGPTVKPPLVVADLNHDGKPEILFGSSAKDNGNRTHHTDDKHSYLFMLNANGQPLWIEPMGGLSSNCSVRSAQIVGDASPKVFTQYQQSRSSNDFSRITRWDALEKTIEAEKGESLSLHDNGFVIHDINNDGRNEILISVDSILKPEIILYSDSLSQISRIAPPTNMAQLLVADLNNDGLTELIASSATDKDKKTVIYNYRYKMIACLDMYGELGVIRQGRAQPNLLHIHNSKGSALYRMVPTPLVQRYPVKTILLSFIAGALAVILFQLLRYQFQSSLSAAGLNTGFIEHHPLGILWVTPKGHVKTYNHEAAVLFGMDERTGKLLILPDPKVFRQKLDDIEKHGKRCGPFCDKIELQINGRQFKLHVFPLRRFFLKKNYLILAEEITYRSVAEQAVLWTDIAQRLAHELKNPLATIQFTLQRLQAVYAQDNLTSRAKYDGYVESSLEEIQRLRRVMDGFQKITRIQEPEKRWVRVVEFMDGIESKLNTWVPKNIKFSIELESDLPDICIDPDQFHSLFFNLVDNATKAFTGEGRIEIRATRGERLSLGKRVGYKQWVFFEINDNGSGITEEHLDTIFDPYVSHREQGTGLGLTICKKIVEDHGGQIRIESKEGIGTHVTIKLPVKDDDRLDGDDV